MTATFGFTMGLAILIRLVPSIPRSFTFAVLVGACIPYALPYVCREYRFSQFQCSSDGRYLTAGTLTGPRTIDLAQLIRIRRVILPAKVAEATVDLLLVMDVHRVQIGLVSIGAREAVRKAVQRQPTEGGPRLRISRPARRLLDDPASLEFFRDVLFSLGLQALCFFMLVVPSSVVALG